MSDGLVTGPVTGPVTVRVPATSANLGPGFDSLGLALTLHDVLTAEVVPGRGEVEVQVEGEGATSVPLDGRHLVVRSVREGFAALGVPAPAFRLRCLNAIPHGRGLGSSSAAIVGGLALARGLVGDGPARLPDAALLALAARIEGHPDNVAPAVLGGLTVAWSEPDGRAAPGAAPGSAPVFRAVRLEAVRGLRAVAFVPPDPLETHVARGLLPELVAHADASHNVGRAALLVAALTGQVTDQGTVPEVLLAGTADRLHQDHRAPAMPRSAELVARLRSLGVAAFVSGAGPTVLALLPGADSPGGAESLAASVDVPGGWRVLPLEVDGQGASLT